MKNRKEIEEVLQKKFPYKVPDGYFSALEDELAKKIKRGRHTTRRAEILALGGGTYLVDTCGFSMLDAVDIPPEDLRLYYDDMERFRKDCRFNTCLHLDEPDCAVKAHIGKGVGEGRYQRYKLIFTELDDRRKNKYD